MYEITIQRVFAAAHALRLPDGSTEPMHGHNWPVEITVSSSQLDAMETVMDFHDLQAIVDDILKCVNNQNLNEIEPFVSQMNPSAERVAEWIGREVLSRLPVGVSLESVRLGEAPGCFALWRP